MAKKQVIANDSAGAAAPKRAAKPTTPTPRVRTSKHSKTVSVIEAVHVNTPPSNIDPHDAIARIAYGYWESRGFQHGMHVEDWLRAEQEYAHTLA